MDYNELINFKKNVCKDYISHYVNDGYMELPPLPLDNKNDITLDFTTCTICSAKDNIRNNIKGKDYVMIQPALRNTHMGVLGKAVGDDYFFSFFSMMGGFKYYKGNNFIEDFSLVIKKEFQYLKKYAEKVVLTIPIQYKDKMEISPDVLDYLEQNNCTIKYSTDDAENLKWKYGMDKVVGYGTRWEVFNGGDLVNWGNTINVYVNNKPYGVDFGGGVESLVYASLKLKSSIYANDGMTDTVKTFCQDDSMKEKIVDCIISSMCIIANKEKIMLRDRYILETYMSILNALMIVNNITKESVLELVNNINSSNILFLNKNNMNDIFSEYLEKATHNHSIVLQTDSINQILHLLDMCYNEKNEKWKNDIAILKSHYRGYFSNLTDVELLALKKSKNKKEGR